MAWPGIAFLLWVWWYWILIAVMPTLVSPVYLDPPGVVGVLLGALAGYIFSIGAVTRRLVRVQDNRPPGSCPGCGYSLIGIQTSVCPECGRLAQHSDVRVFALTRPMRRLSMSASKRWRWLPRVAQTALILYLLAFPRTVLITGGCICTDFVFRHVLLVAHPWAYRIMDAAGLGDSGEGDGDVIDCEGCPPEQPLPAGRGVGW